MIARLRISNYAIIDRLDIAFEPGLNVMTGETGAGKSIMLGAFSLVMGRRADTKSLFNANEKCIVDAEFTKPASGVLDLLRAYDLDAYDDLLLIRREVNPNGRSRAFVNDTPVNLQQLEQITGMLVDLHQQFATLEIRDTAYQMEFLDVISGCSETKFAYRKSYNAYRDERAHLEALLEEDKKSRQEKDYLQFQVEELFALNLDPDDDQDLESTLYALENAEKIKQLFLEIWHHLKNSDPSVTDQLQALQNNLDRMGAHHELSRNIGDRILSAIADLEDIAETCLDESDQMDFDEAEIEAKRERMDRINALLLKHSATDVNALIEIQQEFESKLDGIASLQADIAAAEEKLETYRAECMELGMKLSKERKAGAPVLIEGILSILRDLNMEKAKVEVAIEPKGSLGPNGIDDIELLFTSNVGKAAGKIKDVASGGELSRLALAIKSLLATHIQLPTMIFDEIDSGVSGDVALKMGRILHDMAGSHQMIVITHSAQIAAQGNVHFHVFKEEVKGKTRTGISLLNENERIKNIAIMLSSDPPSAAATANAKELLSTI